ncbi:iron-containing redox enzyme family protein [Kribbella sp. C-35]
MTAGAARLGASEAQSRYFTEHVEADAVHEQTCGRPDPVTPGC